MSKQIQRADARSEGKKIAAATPENLLQLFERKKSAIAGIMPKHLTPERLMKVVISAVSRTPLLAECTLPSVFLAAVQCAELGLEPNTPLGLIYLVPYWNGKIGRREAQVIVGYRGLVRLAVQSGDVRAIQAYVVHSRDTWEVEYGLEPRLVHKPYFGVEEPGDPVAFYAVAELREDFRVFAVMTKREVDVIRERVRRFYPDGKPIQTPWDSDYEEMGKKTAIRRLSKILPLTVDRLAKALAIQARNEADEPADFSDVMDMIGGDPELGQLEEPKEPSRVALGLGVKPAAETPKPEAVPVPAGTQTAPTGEAKAAPAPAQSAAPAEMQSQPATASAADEGGSADDADAGGEPPPGALKSDRETSASVPANGGASNGSQGGLRTLGGRK
jgi:recombination protein RecT